MFRIFDFTDAESSSETATKKLGNLGEKLAANFLTQKGFRLVAANFLVPVGRNRRGAQVTAEIDLIAYERETLCFVEVKTRRSAEFTAIESNVDLRKQRQITRAARAYRKYFRARAPFRYDVVTVLIADETQPAKIELLRNFWTEEKFRKKNWSDDLRYFD
jgi:putative endonuclease